MRAIDNGLEKNKKNLKLDATFCFLVRKQVRGDILLVFLSKKMKAIDKKLKKFLNLTLKKCF